MAADKSTVLVVGICVLWWKEIRLSIILIKFVKIISDNSNYGDNCAQIQGGSNMTGTDFFFL